MDGQKIELNGGVAAVAAELRKLRDHRCREIPRHGASNAVAQQLREFVIQVGANEGACRRAVRLPAVAVIWMLVLATLLLER